MWSEIVQLKVIEDDPGMLHFKYNYDSDYKRCKYKTTSTSHVEINRTVKRQVYKSPKGITSAKKKGLFMLCKKGFIPKQHHAFFSHRQSQLLDGRKMILILTVILRVRKMNLLIHIKIGQNQH